MVNTLGASVIGPLHIQLNLPNQDAWCSCKDSNFNLITVCDGIGSCKQSHIGSRNACKAMKLACKLYTQNACQAPIENLLKLFHQIWLMLIYPCHVEDCRTTCLFAFNFKDRVFLGQLGDGMVAVLSNDQVIYPFGSPDKEFANMTYGLDKNFYSEHWNLCDLSAQDIDAVVLATDGVADDLTPNGSIRLIKDLSDSVQNQHLSRCARNLKFFFRHWPCPNHTDDKTLVILNFK